MVFIQKLGLASKQFNPKKDKFFTLRGFILKAQRIGLQRYPPLNKQKRYMMAKKLFSQKSRKKVKFESEIDPPREGIKKVNTLSKYS